MSLLDDLPIVIAEIGGNAAGDLGLAKSMIRAAVDAGTPYVKFQTYQAERLLARTHPAFDTFGAEGFSFDAFRKLKQFCDDAGAVFLSTPFDSDSVDFLFDLGVPAFKIASGDLDYLPLLEHTARKNKPILLSTGSSSWEDIDRAVEAIRGTSSSELILFHCTAAYPCPDDEANISLIPELAKRYGCRVGFSDHTEGIDVAVAGIGLGAVFIEKHFTTDRELPGGDNDISITPDQLGALVQAVRRVTRSIGNPKRKKTASEEKSAIRMHRSLVARRPIARDATLVPEDLDSVRSADGLPPWRATDLLGKKLLRDVLEGEVMSLEMFE